MNPEVFFDQKSELQIASFAKLALEILEQYGAKDCKVECINFEFNGTFSVLTPSGEKFALRLNINSTRQIENIRAEIEWVRSLVPSRLINVPRPIANNNSEFITSALHQESGRLVHAVMYSWLEGEEIGDNPTLAQLQVVGQTIAQLHLQAQSFQLSSSASLPIFDDLLWGTKDFLFGPDSTLSSNNREALLAASTEIMKHIGDFFRSNSTHIIHADLHGWNLMWNEGQVHIFDFDDCGFGLEVQDIAIALYYLDTPEQEKALLDGYESVRPLPLYSEQSMKALLLQRRLMLLNYLFETKNHEHKAMLPGYLEKTLERVAAFLADVRG